MLQKVAAFLTDMTGLGGQRILATPLLSADGRRDIREKEFTNNISR